MNPFKIVTRPVKDVVEALVMPLRALFVVAVTGLVNAMTFSGTWWFKWVALGMGIAVVVSLGRALKSLLVLALVAWVGWKIHQRYGARARRHFDDWMRRRAPRADEGVAAWRRPAGGPPGAAPGG